MYGISGEHILILLVILLIFGPRRLPDLGHSIGRTMKNFRDGMSGKDPVTAPAAPVAVAQQLEIRPEANAPLVSESAVVEEKVEPKV